MSSFIEKRSVIQDTARIDYEGAIVYDSARVNYEDVTVGDTAIIPTISFLMMSESNLFIVTEDEKLINI